MNNFEQWPICPNPSLFYQISGALIRIIITCNKFSIDGGGCMRKIHCKSSFALLTGGVAVRKIIYDHLREEVKYILC